MNKQTARELLMEYLYNEISVADKKKLEIYLEDHPEMQREVDELRTTRSLLQQAPEVKSEKDLIMTEPRERSFADWWQNAKTVLPRSGWGKTALVTVACLLLLLVTSAIADLNIQSNASGFSISFGNAGLPQSAVMTKAQTEAIVQQIKQENTAILTEYADMLSKHNKQQLQQVVEYFERQRLNDLQLVEQALSAQQQETETQLRQTNQVLGEVIQTVSTNN